MIKRHFAARWMAFLAIAVIGLLGFSAISALADDYPRIDAVPTSKMKDKNNVDMLSGQVSLNQTDVSIGGDQGLSHTVFWGGNGQWYNIQGGTADNYRGYLDTNGLYLDTSSGPSVFQCVYCGNETFTPVTGQPGYYVGNAGSTISPYGNNKYSYLLKNSTGATVAAISNLNNQDVHDLFFNVVTGAASERFIYVNNAFVSYSNKGGKLIDNGDGTFTYTDAAGVIYKIQMHHFVMERMSFWGNGTLGNAALSGWEGGGGSITKVNYPNGVVHSIYWDTNWTILYGVTTNTGFQLKYTYSGYSLASVVAFNSSVDYCNPASAAACTFSRAWPTASYTAVNDGGGGYGIAVTDQFNRITDYYSNNTEGNSYVSIKTPESSGTSANIKYTICVADTGDQSALNRPCYTEPYRFQGEGNTYPAAAGKITTVSDDGVLTQYSYGIAIAGYYDAVTAKYASGNQAMTFSGNGHTCSYWDTCLEYATDKNGRINYDYLNSHDKPSSYEFDGITDTYTYNRINISQTSRTPKANSGLSTVNVVSNFDTACSNYVTCNLPNSKLDGNGNETDYTYDPAHGGVLTVTSPADISGVHPQTRNIYALFYPKTKDASGNLVTSTTGIYLLARSSTCMSATSTNPASCVGTDKEIVTVYAYDSNNLFLTSKTVMSGSSATNPTLPYSSTNLWQTTSYGYDAVGNLVSEDGPLPTDVDKKVYRYNALNFKIGEVGPDPDGASTLPRIATRTTYNSAGQVTLVETGTMTGQGEADWANFAVTSQVATSYDNYGRVAMVRTSSAGNIYSLVQTSYDPTTSRVSCIATRMNTTLFASATTTDNACVRKADGAAGPDRITKFTYDIFDNLTSITKAAGVTGLEQIYATFTYGMFGLKTSEVDSNGNKSLLSYDGLDRLLQLTYPSTTAGSGALNSNDYEWYTYDNNGNRTGMRRRDGRWLYYSYDHLNREVVAYPSDSSIPWLYSDYDLLGRPCIKAYTVDIRAQGPDCGALFTNLTTTGAHFMYDALGRLVSAKDTNGRALSYLYNQASARTQMTYPDANYITSDLDNLNRLLDVKWSGTTVLFSQTYNPLGLRASLGRGTSGGQTTYTWDNLARITQVTNDLSGTATDITWNFTDASGNPAYNPAGQLTKWSASSNVYDYTETANSTDSRTYDGLNRDAGIVSVNGGTGYDSNGNIRNDGSRYLLYDIYNRLISVAVSPTVQPYLLLDYDPMGRLASTTFNGTTTSYLYDDKNLIAEYNGATMLRRYVHGNGQDEPLVWFEGTGTAMKSYFYQNSQGSIIAVANSSGVIDPVNYPQTAIYKYSPYGEPLVATNPTNWGQLTKSFSGARFRYTGQTTIPEAGLYYYRARVYDPAFGRFMQTDPIGSKDNLDLYVYTGDDPVNASDPEGTSTLTYDDNSHTLTLNRNDGTSQTFVAYNNPQRSARGPFPTGTHAYAGAIYHGDDPNSKTGPRVYVFNVQDVPGYEDAEGYSVHSGHQDQKDGLGRTGPQYATNGCIRTTDEATQAIQDTIDSGDPLTSLTVNRGDQSTASSDTRSKQKKDDGSKDKGRDDENRDESFLDDFRWWVAFSLF